MSTTKKTKPPANKKTPAKKPAAKKPAVKAAAKKVAAAPAKAKAAVKRTLQPKPKATHPSKKDVGIFGTIQKNIQEGIAVITETILPTPKKKARKR
jgi:hypothetical protein